MLPDINLDNEKFDDILENAKNSIVTNYPGWTDFNYHDPGITMLEMFAWLKEIQQYYLNKIGPDSIRKYLKLLGIRRGTKRPSGCGVTVLYHDNLIIPEGMGFYAGDIRFEAVSRTFVSSARIECCVCRDSDEVRVIDRAELSFGGSMRIMPFLSGKDSEFYIGFDRPLEKGEQHLLFVEISDSANVGRNPITDPDGFIPLADVAAEYYGSGGWRSLDCEDPTFGFLCSGTLRLCPENAHLKTEVGGRSAYFIRFRFTGGEYDVLPVIRNLQFNLLPVIQRETKAECRDFPANSEFCLFSELAARGSTRVYLLDGDGLFTPAANYEKSIDEATGEVRLSVAGADSAKGVRVVNISPDFIQKSEIGFGTGLPFQKFSLETEALEYESFCLMTELPTGGGKLIEWKKVSDFSSAKAEDCVYFLDTAAGEIRFGDCIRGAAPEGRVYIVGCAFTLGASGNVSAGKINRASGFDDEGLTVTNTRGSSGGMDEETVESCCARAYRLMQTTETPVTDEDYERLVMNTQGLMVETCRLLPASRSSDQRPDPVRSIVVKPYSPNGRGVPGERYCRNIINALESRRMLGVGFRIVKPEYAAIRVYADISAERSATNAKKEVEIVIKGFFEEHSNRFGVKLIYSKLCESIDRLPYVVSLNTLTMETQGSGAERDREGDLQLSPNVTAYLSEIDLRLSAVR